MSRSRISYHVKRVDTTHCGKQRAHGNGVFVELDYSVKFSLWDKLEIVHASTVSIVKAVV